MRKTLAVFIVAASLGAVLCTSGSALAYTAQDVDRLTTLAAIYGRATACGADVDGPIGRTGAWIDATFGSERGTYLQIFMAGMRQNAQSQASGAIGESCSSVLYSFRSMGL